MNIIEQLKLKRIGPDLAVTHWLLHFKFGQKIIKKKFAKCGKNVQIRPGCILVNLNLIEMGDNVVIRPGTQIYANTIGKARVVIENNVLIAPNVFIATGDHDYKNPNVPIIFQGGVCKSITIKEGAFIGVNAVILKGVTIGKNSVVGAGAIVTKDVPDYCVVGGVPAKIISKIK